MASHLGNGRSILLSYGGMPQRGIWRTFAAGGSPAGRRRRA